MRPAHDVPGRAVGGRDDADELVPAHAAPGPDVRVGGRVVGLDGHRRAHVYVADVPGEVEDRQRAAAAAGVDDHRPVAPSSARTSATTCGSAARNASTCSSVVPACTETRTLPEVSAPIATRTCDGSSVVDVH